MADVGVGGGDGGEVDGGWGLGIPKPPERRTRRCRVLVAIACLPLLTFEAESVDDKTVCGIAGDAVVYGRLVVVL